MLASALGLLLAAAPHLSLVVLDDAGQARAAEAAAAALGKALEAAPVRLDAYLKAAGPACRADVRCLAAAPELGEVPRLLVLELRLLPSGPLAAELRLVDRSLQATVGRSAAVVDKAELPAWAARAAARLVRTSAAGALPPSAFSPGPLPATPSGVKASSPAPAVSAPLSPSPGPEQPARSRRAPEDEWRIPEGLQRSSAPSAQPGSEDDK